MKWFNGIVGILMLGGGLAWYWQENDLDKTESIADIAPRPAETPTPTSTVVPATSEEFPNPPAPTYLENLQEFLRRGNFSAAVEVYNRVYNISDDSESKELSAAMLKHAGALQTEGALEKSEALLLAYLAAFYRDVDALLLLADNYHLQGNLPSELETLFKIYDFAYQTETLNKLKLRITKIASRYRRQLKKQDNYATIVELYQSLVAKFPDNGRYYIDLARQYIANNELEEARQVLTQVNADATVGRIAEKLLAKIEQQQSVESIGKILVPLIRLNSNHYAVRAMINGRATIKLLIDTGASMSVIRPQALNRAGPGATSVVRYISLNTANGITEAPVVALQSMTIGGQTVSNIQVAALDLQGLSRVDGLLGMDFLKNFEFAIHQSTGQLQLSKSN